MGLSEYVLEPLRKEEEFILYRGQHRNQVDALSVLLLAPVSTHPALESLKRIEHEYSLRAELDLLMGGSAPRSLPAQRAGGARAREPWR